METTTTAPALTLEQRVEQLELMVAELLAKKTRPAKELTEEARLKRNEASREAKLKQRAAEKGLTVDQYKAWQELKKNPSAAITAAPATPAQAEKTEEQAAPASTVQESEAPKEQPKAEEQQKSKGKK